MKKVAPWSRDGFEGTLDQAIESLNKLREIYGGSATIELTLVDVGFYNELLVPGFKITTEVPDETR